MIAAFVLAALVVLGATGPDAEVAARPDIWHPSSWAEEARVTQQFAALDSLTPEVPGTSILYGLLQDGRIFMVPAGVDRGDVLAEMGPYSPAAVFWFWQTADCQYSTINMAHMDASNGDTILMPTCSETIWGSDLAITKCITLAGNGAANTIIGDSLNSSEIISLDQSVSCFQRLTGFTLDANETSKSGNNGSVHVNGLGGGSYDNYRIDHLTLDNIRGRGIVLEYEAQFISGLIDNDYFHCTTTGQCQSVTCIGADPQVSSHMGRAFDIESNKTTFFEDNLLQYDADQDGDLEGYGGCWYEFRFNEVHTDSQGHHGADSGGYRGTQVFLIYKNSFDLDGCDGVPMGTDPCLVRRPFSFRSGTGILAMNTFKQGDYNNFDRVLDLYRASSGTGYDQPPWYTCRSVDDVGGGWPYAHDGRDDTSGGDAYPCLDQIGHMFTDVLDGTNLLKPLYQWQNESTTAAQMDFTGNALGGNISSDIVEDREFYLWKKSFDCSTGVGIGTASTMSGLSGCTTGVGFWVTDEYEWDADSAGVDGRLYYWDGATWSVWWQPYPHPHPLAAVAAGGFGPFNSPIFGGGIVN